MEYLYHIETELYIIKIYPREDGHTRCFYKIANDDAHDLWEASNTKIFRRLSHTFGLYKDYFSEDEVDNVLSEVSKVLKVNHRKA